MNVFFLPSRPINHVFVECVLTVMKRPTLRTVVEIVNTLGIARTVTLSELSLHHPCYYQCRANMTTSHCQSLTVKIQLHISGLQKVILIFPNHKTWQDDLGCAGGTGLNPRVIFEGGEFSYGDPPYNCTNPPECSRDDPFNTTTCTCCNYDELCQRNGQWEIHSSCSYPLYIGQTFGPQSDIIIAGYCTDADFQTCSYYAEEGKWLLT